MAGTLHTRARSRLGGGPDACAALDLGTNNCRLLVAQPAANGFRVLDGFSQIVRLGEGLAASGRLSEAAMDRALAALRSCAQKISAHPGARIRSVATQACRVASNGPEFLARARAETGLEFSVITPEEEARLAVLGCAPLVDGDADLALVIDVGGGSTELSWVDAAALRAGEPCAIRAWTSLPFGVVTLAEEHLADVDGDEWYENMVERVAVVLRAYEGAEALRPLFENGRAHYLGASGTVTSLAGVLLGLPRYQRNKVDGVWLSVDQACCAIERLRRLGRGYRSEHPCIGVDRADLVVPGGAILEAIFRVWPAQRIRVADRGLREGMLYALMKDCAAERLAHGRR